LETYLEPAETTLEHSHPVDTAVIFLTDGKFQILEDDGSSRESSAKQDSVAFGTAPTVHRTRNIGTDAARVIGVEIFSLPSASGNLDDGTTPGEILIDNTKVRMWRLRLAPRAAVQLAGPTASIVVALTPGTLTFEGEESAKALERGEVMWLESEEGLVRNGEDQFDAIVVQLKTRN
jgi:quercetin dioxygenase-like cupin family protein